MVRIGVRKMMIETGEVETNTPEFQYGTQRFVYVDIETLPTQSADVIANIAATIKPPGTLKKQDSIDAWHAEHGAAAAAEATLKTSFDGGRGHVCTISWAKNGGEVITAHATAIEQEAEVIAAFFADLDPYHSETLVGHNVTGFDIPFLLKRAVVLGLKLPPPSSLPRDPKPWGNACFDTMTAWAGQRGTISMDNLSRALGIEGKGDFDGSMVAEAWANGEHAKIEEYCRHDVQVVRDIHRKFMAAGW